MSNSIRTPRQGKTARSRRIAWAVDNEDWQAFRESLKQNYSTAGKLDMLRKYFTQQRHTHSGNCVDIDNCCICIRVDNYIKALCRGGQLQRGESLLTAAKQGFHLEVVR